MTCSVKKMKSKPVSTKVRRTNWYGRKSGVITTWVVEIFVTLVLAALFAFAFCSGVTIQENSMDPTVVAGETVLINRIAYTVSGVKRGDLIAYRTNDKTDASVHVKRVIGLPGEKIQIRDGLILINGKTYFEDTDLPGINNPGLAEEGVTVKDGEYFVLGDNRNMSEDSRFADVGNIQKGYIIGKVWLISQPLSEFGLVK